MVHTRLEPCHGDLSVPTTLADVVVLACFCLSTTVLLAAMPNASHVPTTPCHFGSSSGTTGGARLCAMVQALLTPGATEMHKTLVISSAPSFHTSGNQVPIVDVTCPRS